MWIVEIKFTKQLPPSVPKEKHSPSMYLTSIQYIIRCACGEIQTVYRVWGLQAADGGIGESCVMYRHASIDRNVAQA